jgi:hypothetical protein
MVNPLVDKRILRPRMSAATPDPLGLLVDARYRAGTDEVLDVSIG